MNESTQAQLQAAISAFASQITDILKGAVAHSVQNALGSSQSAPATKGRGTQGKKRGRPPGRPAKALDTDAIMKEIRAKAGQRSEELAKKLRVDSKKLSAALKHLLATKKVKKSGKARGTTYRAA